MIYSISVFKAANFINNDLVSRLVIIRNGRKAGKEVLEARSSNKTQRAPSSKPKIGSSIALTRLVNSAIA